MFVRVRDKTTGHEYDVPEKMVNPEAHEVLSRFPKSATARRQKYRVNKAGRPARPKTEAPASEPVGRPAKHPKEK